MRGVTYGHGDSRGRWHYSLHWTDNYFPGHPEGEYVERERGQHFFGVPPKDVKNWTHEAE